ncbi:hypothetical protein LH128_03834 [Sphingomonas sp. LH128]|uniref:hypothetical protein n=1 Tax=Sphingomonas sp. LH128 TaxID=473781 RepID=UPI00027CBBB8|nr:hypothetical protein [Sphingomonas sp. LH128]EJU14414.1 hypothetical protein LH128_03834 [Sphingomonas sp. LH128]
MKAARPLALLFSVVPMALIVAPPRASGIFRLRLADAPPLLGLGAYIISAYLSERAPWMLFYALCIAGIPVAAYGPRRAGWALFAALAASLVYARVFMEN